MRFVDDEEELVATMKERLEMRGIAAEAVTTGSEGLECFRNAPFDVVVVDLKMPGLGGTEVVEQMRADMEQVAERLAEAKVERSSAGTF